MRGKTLPPMPGYAKRTIKKGNDTFEIGVPIQIRKVKSYTVVIDGHTYKVSRSLSKGDAFRTAVTSHRTRQGLASNVQVIVQSITEDHYELGTVS